MHPKYTSDMIKRFWAKVEKTDGCWLWTASINGNGYGQLSIRFSGKKPRPFLAHRMSFELHSEANADGMYVCHRCDNPRCVRPEHLFLGTARDNIHDMIAKGRDYRGEIHYGEKVHNALLNDEKVRQIRKMHEDGTHTLYEMADMFGVKYVTIWSVVRRTAWKHIP